MRERSAERVKISHHVPYLRTKTKQLASNRKVHRTNCHWRIQIARNIHILYAHRQKIVFLVAMSAPRKEGFVCREDQQRWGFRGQHRF